MKNINNKRKIAARQKGFTIIETLVAITVLMIAVAGPLVVASKGLFGATLSKNQMTASYLAQESMEFIKNARDNNLSVGANWLTGLSGCTSSSPCDASAIDGLQSNCGVNPCRIYIGTNGYGHDSSKPASAFSRWFYIHAPGTTDSCPGSGECGVTVETYWNEAAIPYSVILTSEITDTLR